MKKIIICASIALGLMTATAIDSSAQVIKNFYKQPYKTRNNGTFSDNTGLFSIGLGVPNVYAGYSSSLPPIYLKYEMGLMDEVGLGFVGGVGLGKYKFDDRAFFETTLGVVAYYHFNKVIPVKNLDVYAGLGLGVNIENRNNNGDANVSVIPLGKAGVRYYFSNAFGVYVESGYDRLSAANLGITLRF